MREIKFRAWSQIDKVMIYDLNSCRLSHGILKDDDYIFMQYTGLKDKTGKEIYVGDIVELNKNTFIIKFGAYDNNQTYEDVEQGYGFYLCPNNWHNPHGIQSYYRIVELIVIGNIYENPELLKE